jgi:hypothetical protein
MYITLNVYFFLQIKYVNHKSHKLLFKEFMNVLNKKINREVYNLEENSTANVDKHISIDQLKEVLTHEVNSWCVSYIYVYICCNLNHKQ